jgi:polyhydroxyalkanoate synthesis regulator phasin
VITLEKLDAIIERIQKAGMMNPEASTRILSILARHRESLSRIRAQVAVSEKMEDLIEEIDAYLDTLPRK